MDKFQNNHHNQIVTYWSIILGMEHDNKDCTCVDDRCIMAPSSSTVPPKHWSSCSLEYLAFAFERGMDYCLRNKPEVLFESPVCGNGFVEPGEQCDCGLPEHCNNSCCNPNNCTLNTTLKNVSCATGECCDLNVSRCWIYSRKQAHVQNSVTSLFYWTIFKSVLISFIFQTCQPKKAGTLCRSADIECDLPEYCNGQSEYCPADTYKMNTELCDGGKVKFKL